MSTDPRVLADQFDPLLEASVAIEASPERVWSLVSDPLLMPRWSPQVWRVIQRRGHDSAVGSRYLNINRAGVLVWPTRSQVVEREPERRFAWRIRDNKVVWSFTLSSDEPGQVTLTQRREAPQGVSDRALNLENRFMGGVPQFQDTLRADMKRTLAAIKAAAEA